MNKHESIRTRERQYECKTCSKIFPRYTTQDAFMGSFNIYLELATGHLLKVGTGVYPCMSICNVVGPRIKANYRIEIMYGSKLELLPTLQAELCRHDSPRKVFVTFFHKDIW